MEQDDALPTHGDLWTPRDGREDPATVRARLKLLLARLSLTQKSAHADDKLLHKLAKAHHDHHGVQAEGLAGEIRAAGVGNDPHLENAQMAHLSEKRDAEQTAIKLHQRITDFVPKVAGG